MSHLLLELSRTKKSEIPLFYGKMQTREKHAYQAILSSLKRLILFKIEFYRKPTCDICVLQSLQGQLLGFRFLIAFLNPERDLAKIENSNLKISEKNFQVFRDFRVFRVFDLAQLTVMYDLSMACFHPEAATGVFCQKRCSQKFHNFHRKTPVPESLF